MLEAARGAHLAHALRHRDGQQSYPRRGRKPVLGNPRANPADRGKDAPQAEAPAPLAQTAQLSRCLSAPSAGFAYQYQGCLDGVQTELALRAPGARPATASQKDNKLNWQQEPASSQRDRLCGCSAEIRLIKRISSPVRS